MNWVIASIITLFLWGTYSVFADKAIRVHGEKVSFVFEVAAMIIIAIVIFTAWGGAEDFKKITSASFWNASLMALMTSGGAFFLLYALRLAPSVDQTPIVVLIAGFYPVLTAVLSYFLLGSKLAPTQWLGVGLAGVALTLINWKPH